MHFDAYWFFAKALREILKVTAKVWVICLVIGGIQKVLTISRTNKQFKFEFLP